MAHAASRHAGNDPQPDAQGADTEIVVRDFCAAVERHMKTATPLPVDDRLLAAALIAAARAYSARVENEMRAIPLDFRSVTGTEAGTAVTALMRAADLNLLDLAMWFHRPDTAESERQQ